MLKKLVINNVALISNLELEFCTFLNILSGETGAGKSIIVDSIMLLLGNRYDKTLLRFGATSGFVEGVFDSTFASNQLLNEYNIEQDDVVIINRKFNDEGKSEIRINGRIATTAMLKQLTAVFVDIYGQNEYQSLAKSSEHLRILDYYVRHNTITQLENIQIYMAELKSVQKQLKNLGNLSERERNIDMLKYQIEEIEKAAIKQGEEEQIIGYRKKVASVEKISGALSRLVNALSENENGETAIGLIDEANNALSGISSYSYEYEELLKRLDSVSIELGDIAQCGQGELNNLEFDANELDKIEKRLDVVRSIKRKYGDFEKMKKFLSEAKEALFTLENCNDLYEKLIMQKSELVNKLYNYSLELSQIRRVGALKFEEEIKLELKSLGMNSLFEIVFNNLPSLNECENYLSLNGLDNVEFYLSPNIGQPLKPLIKIISGGEMSRFMLALKVISSKNDEIPTMIFDEIDTGISGMIGQEVAKKLATISRYHQVLCVTHLPQIAAMADNHYFINKVITGENTFTTVELLNESSTIDELSRLSGAKDISAQSFINAAEMKKWSDNYKAKI